jgi:spore maturation protein CgeB
MHLAFFPSTIPALRLVEKQFTAFLRKRKWTVTMVTGLRRVRWFYGKKRRLAYTARSLRRLKPDLVFCLNQAAFTPADWRELKNLAGFRLASWWLAPDLSPAAVQLAPGCDCFCTPLVHQVEALKKAGAGRVEVVAPGFDPSLYRKQMLSTGAARAFSADLAYTGPLTGKSLQDLRPLGDYDFKLWGPARYRLEGPGNKIRNVRLGADDPFTAKFSGTRPGPARLRNIYNASRIILNLHPPDDPESLFRDYAILGCGAFLITDRPDWLEPGLRTGEDFESFQTPDELKEKITYYLNNPKERAYLARSGFENTVQNHTWEKRFTQLAGILSEVTENKG